MRSIKWYLLLCICVSLSCQKLQNKGTFGDDINFLRQKIDPIILKNGDKQVIVSSEFQGRILVSTAKGLGGPSYGWYNKSLISSDSVFQNISKVGGAGRIWFGPDQGENDVFVAVNPKTNEVTRRAPKDLDTLTFNVLEQSDDAVTLYGSMHIQNLKHSHFYVDINRKIELLNTKQVEANLGVSLTDKTDFVAYRAETSMTNIGNDNWQKEQGLISLWELGCMQPTPNTTVIIPLKSNVVEPTIYFTDLDNNRIQVENNVLFYKADADYLNKIGTLPEISRPIFGSYSPELNLLTIVRYLFAGGRDYVNALPEGKDPYRGDVIKIFNDGTWGEIGPFGPFYELETSSPAKALKAGESLSHYHETYHFEGSKEKLTKISLKVLGVSIDTIEKMLP